MLLESSLFPQLSLVHVWCSNFNIPNPSLWLEPFPQTLPLCPNLPFIYISYYFTLALTLSGAAHTEIAFFDISCFAHKVYFIFGSPNCAHLYFYLLPSDFCQLFWGNTWPYKPGLGCYRRVEKQSVNPPPVWFFFSSLRFYRFIGYSTVSLLIISEKYL